MTCRFRRVPLVAEAGYRRVRVAVRAMLANGPLLLVAAPSSWVLPL